jgi:NIMA (never in mitosis gene a)-related kinase
VTLLKALKHPNIVRTIESFEEDDSLHIVMEYCECGDLAMRIKSQAKTGNRFTRRRVLEWFVQIVSAVGHIHSKKILHRDLKTNNVFLARNNVIKLGDFGIAKALQTASMANTVIGTPYYMSPEICSNTPYSYESDMVRRVLSYDITSV